MEITRIFTIHENESGLLCFTALIEDAVCTNAGSAWADPPILPEYSAAVCTAFGSADCCDLPSDYARRPINDPQLLSHIEELDLDWTPNF